ncbi:MAG: hypothetical protein AAGD43_02860 [Pseudomonadota bacterium]
MQCSNFLPSLKVTLAALLIGVPLAPANATDKSYDIDLPDGVSISVVNDVSQVTKNTETVFNLGFLGFDDLLGDATSATVQATGAASSVSIANINIGVTFSFINQVYQSTTNKGDVINIGLGDIDGGAIKFDDIKGNVSAVQVAATGAVSGASITNIGDGGYALGNIAIINDVESYTKNSGGVLNVGAISASNLEGVASSISISATGAATSVAIANITQHPTTNVNIVNDISSTTTNKGTVINVGAAHVGDLSGTASSVSISATGASSAVSISNIVK